MITVCRVCGYPENECVCLDCCGHDCLLDQGLDFCPVCKPEPNESPCGKPQEQGRVCRE